MSGLAWDEENITGRCMPPTSREPPRLLRLDGAPTLDVLRYVLWCAESWEGEARLLGNARAADIVRALRDVLQPAPPSGTPEGGDQ